MDITVKAKIPTIPNFIMIDKAAGTDAKVKIGDLSDDELSRIADEWKKELLKHAKYQREQSYHP
jgi:ribosomal protein S13